MKWLVYSSICILTACDNSQALHEPHPSLERMQIQERVNPFDARGMRAPPPDTVTRDNDATLDALDDAGEMPVDVDLGLLEEGRTSFDRICATCHGVLGDGDSVVASKMKDRPPPSLHDQRAVSLGKQQLYDVITNGYGLMPPYAHQLAPRERWAVIAYLDALRLSRHATVANLPLDVQRELNEQAAK